MVYVTQSRLEPNTQYCKTYQFGVSLEPSSRGTRVALGQVNPVQVTSSWRTGRRVEGLDDEHEAELFNISNQAEFFGYLKEDEDQYSAQSSYDTGHVFDTTSKRIICTPSVDFKFGAFGTSKPYRYEGVFFADPSYFVQAPFQTIYDVNTSYYGPAAVAACAPTHPLVTLSVDAAEFKSEGARLIGASLLKHATRGLSVTKTIPAGPAKARFYWKKSKNGKRRRVLVPGTSKFDDAPITSGGTVVSEEYLNWQFGLKPILADVNKSLISIQNAARLLDQYHRDSGKLVRRSYHFPLQRETLYESSSGEVGQLNATSASSIANSYAFVGGNRYGVQTRSIVKTTEIWFEGAFTYYLPEVNSLLDSISEKERDINHLFGTRVTPETLWNLQPWSWLADWTANIGTNIANAELLSTDGLVMKYGYLMCKTTIDHTVVLNGVACKSGYTGPYTTIYRTQRKQRVKASPFGFSLNPSSFTARQWAILGALGYTKSPQSLKTV